MVHFSSTKYINNNSINNSNKKQYLQYLRLANVNSIYFSDVTPNEVLGHIFELKNNSSSGPSDIPNIFMKIIALQLAFILTYLVNRSFKEGYFPKLLKIGKQTPVFKSGENYLGGERRPFGQAIMAKNQKKVVEWPNGLLKMTFFNWSIKTN